MADKFKRGKPGRGILPNLPDETMTPSRLRVQTNGEKEAWRYSYKRDHTTHDFRSGLNLGNGDIGCMVHGYPDALTFDIAKNDLWWDDFTPTEPTYYTGGIEEIRERVASGDISIKNDIYEASNRRINYPNQTTAARLTLHLKSGAVFANFKESLDIATGFTVTTFNASSDVGIRNGSGFKVLSATSRIDNVLAITCFAPSEQPSLGRFSFELSRPVMEVSDNIGRKISEDEIKRLEDEIDEYYSPQTFTDGNFAGFTMRLRAGEDPNNSPDVHYTVLATVPEGNTKYYTGGNTVHAEGKTGRILSLLLTVVSTYDAEDTVAEAKKRLQNVMKHSCSGGYADNAYAENVHSWRRSWVRLPEEKYSRLWYWGLYEAYSARCPGKFAAGYVAPWHPLLYPNWGCNILTYEQTKTNLGLLASNRAELLEPWFRLCIDAQENIKKFTKDFYGMNGTCFPHAISSTGVVVTSSRHCNNTMMNIQTAGETVKYAWDYYDFTGDIDFLREIGYPLLKEVAIFYSEYLQEDEDGTKYIFPSRSQEFTNGPSILNEFMTNSIIDLAMFKFIFDRASKSARILGIDEELAAKWEDDLAHLRPDYATWPDGTWKTAEDTDNRTIDYGVPSVSDLAPIVLTDEVDAWRGSEELRRAAKLSTYAFVPEDKMPWDLSFGILAKLRMGDKKYAKLVLELLPKSREGGNLDRADACDFDANNEMQPDHRHEFYVNKGGAYFTEVVNEMLLQSQGGIIRLFPAYPEDIGDAAFFSLRARGAFLVSGEFRDGKIAYGIIRSLKGNKCVIANPFGDNAQIRNLETGEIVEATEVDGNFTFKTIAENEYVIEDKNHPLESFPIIGAQKSFM